MLSLYRVLNNRLKDRHERGVSMNYIIAADSSANLLRAEGMNYTSVPLKIVAGEKEYVDDEKLDTELMLSELAA